MAAEGAHTCVASLDVGTTGIRCILYDKKAKVVAESYEKIRLIQGSPGASEIDPLELWELAKKVINASLTTAGITAAQVSSLGMTTMRSSILTWDRTSGKPAHNIITWQDTRAQAICDVYDCCAEVYPLLCAILFNLFPFFFP